MQKTPKSAERNKPQEKFKVDCKIEFINDQSHGKQKDVDNLWNEQKACHSRTLEPGKIIMNNGSSLLHNIDKETMRQTTMKLTIQRHKVKMTAQEKMKIKIS